MKPVGIFANIISKCPDIMRKRTPILLHRVPPVWSNKVKDYVSSVGSPCNAKILPTLVRGSWSGNQYNLHKMYLHDEADLQEV